jgi:uncharacterized protein (TIGR02147 family)
METSTPKQDIRPEVTSFLVVSEYLQALYAWRKRKHRGFSYTTWADELGFKNRVFLRLIVVGKRSITENSIPLFIDGLKLKKSDGEYFSLLVRLNQAGNLSAREHYARELSLLRKRSGLRTEIRDQYLFLSSHLAPRLQVLISMDGLNRSPENLAWLLGTTRSKTQEMLEMLERLELARLEPGEDGAGQWVGTKKDFEVKQSLGNIALQSFHRRSLEEAISAIDSVPESRRYQSGILPLPADKLQSASEEINDFLRQFLDKYKVSQGSNRRLYQINLNIFPVSKPILQSASVGMRQSVSAHDYDETKETWQ